MISIQRISAVVFRHFMTIARISWLVEITYWTALDIVIFGSLGRAMSMTASQGATSMAISALITNVVLWYIVLRGAITIGFAFLNELFDANLTTLFASPLRVIEWMSACAIVGSIAAVINLLTGWIMAELIFGNNIFSAGWPVLAAIGSLILSSWIVGFVLMSVLLFVGKRGTGLAFAICWSLVPFSCVYYPMDVLPLALQYLAQFIPMAQTLVGMRAFIMYGTNPWTQILISYGLNLAYLTLAFAFFAIMFQRSKNRGLARLELEW